MPTGDRVVSRELENSDRLTLQSAFDRGHPDRTPRLGSGVRFPVVTSSLGAFLPG